MFFNKNSQSNTAGSELFAGDDSFMIELQPTDLDQISGGYGHGGGGHNKKEKCSWKKSYKNSWKKSWKKSHGTTSYCPPVEKCPPVYCPPVVYCPPKKSYC
jgi:uncharacterized membrane protein